jgi:PIN domain nuclease of toxin-antitoxin system
MTSVLDACALIAFLTDEPGADRVATRLAGEPGSCRVHALNLCEVYYDFLRRAGEATAERAVDELLDLGLVLRDDLDPAFWRAAGRVKARFRLSLADAVCTALAQRDGADLVTTDQKEFGPIAEAGIVRVVFAR